VALDPDGTLDYFTHLWSCHTYGEEKLFHVFNGSDPGVTADFSVGVFTMGGWAEWTAPDEMSKTDSDVVTALVPYELPENGPFWTRAGAVVWTSNSGSSTNAAIRCATVGAASTCTHQYGAAAYDTAVTARMDQIAGGDANSNDSIIRLASDDGAVRYEIDIWFDKANDRWQWIKNSGTSITMVAWDWSAKGGLEFHMMLDATNLKGYLFYRGTNEDEWVEDTNSPVTLTNMGTSGQSEIVIGDEAGATQTVDWNFISVWAEASTGEFAPDDAAATLRPARIGSNPYPLPGIGPDTQIARLKALAGPARLGEGYDIDVDADYPLSACYPRVSPSPSNPWRSEGTDPTVAIAENIPYAWDLDYVSSLGNHTLMVGLFGCNLRSAVLEGQTAGAG